MKKRIVCFVLALVLTLSLVPAVSAADHGMNDIVGHWAEKDISWVLDQGLFNGTSAATFNPNGTMTRGMFVTVLGRYAGVDPAEYQDWYMKNLFQDVDPDAYYAPYVNWAARHGITSGTGAATFSPNAPITREQMATFLLRFANCYGYVFEPISDDVPGWFDDQADIAGYAVDAVEIMRESGVITGRANAGGGFDFDPRALAVRSECAAVFHRLMSAMVIDENFFFEEPEEIALFNYDGAELQPGDSFRLDYATIPENPTNATITWVSSDPSIFSVASDGTVTCRGRGQAQIYAYTCNGIYDCVTVSSDVYIGYQGESYESKCMHIFGRVVDDPRHPYNNNSDPEEFEENIVTVTVQVWDFKDKTRTEKVTKTMKIQVHKNLAATVKALFAEIYACEEQYPINYLGGYRFCTKSEHTPGLAIDINYESNPYVDPNGKVITGKKFDPENDPYSIPLDGEVEQIFEKYGFRRGTWWKSGYKDYMHFSFFGT